MPEIGTSGSMSGDGKRSVGHRPQATAPILDSTDSAVAVIRPSRQLSAPAARLTPLLDQRTIGSDHRQVHLVINIV
jgi:hypothetical protein